MLEEKYPQADRTSFGFANRFTVGDRFIVSACEYINDHSDEVDYDTATDAILSIKYVDKPLRNTVLDERVSQLDKSNSNRALRRTFVNGAYRCIPRKHTFNSTSQPTPLL